LWERQLAQERWEGTSVADVEVDMVAVVACRIVWKGRSRAEERRDGDE
jgi:hypothetical protein